MEQQQQQRWLHDDHGVKRRFMGNVAGFVFMPERRSVHESDLLSLPADVVAIVEDYEALEVSSDAAALRNGPVPPVLVTLGHEASLLAVCVLRKYVFAPEPPAGTLSRAVLQSLLNLAVEYIPTYVEKMYWLQKSHAGDPTIKLYTASLLRAFDVFLLELASILTTCQKKNKRFRSEPLQHQRDALLNGFAAYLKARQTTCIHNVEPSAGLRMAKVARVKVLYSSRMQRVFGDARHWQAGLWMSSAVKSVAPLIVTVIDRYATPYSIAVILNRMLDVLIENGEAQVPVDVAEEIKKPHAATEPQTFGNFVYKSVAEEQRISNMYGALISSITTSLLSVVEMTGLFRVVVQAVVKPLRLIFEKSIGTALSLALESSPDDDLRKVRFMMKMLFGDEVAQSSMHKSSSRASLLRSSGASMTGVETLEDLLSSAFNDEVLDDLADLLKKLPLDFVESPQQRHAYVTQFYERDCVAKLERVLLLELSKKSKSFARACGDYLKQFLVSLVSTLALVLRDDRLLDVLVWDYLLPQLLA